MTIWSLLIFGDFPRFSALWAFKGILVQNSKNNEDWEIFQDNRFNVNYPIEGAKKFFAGGCGLSSTLKDYYNFLSVFINEGKFNGKQFISKKTNELIFENQLPEKFNFGVGLAFGVVI